jgi:hypothetical protein
LDVSKSDFKKLKRSLIIKHTDVTWCPRTIISFSNYGNRIPKEQVKWEIQKDRIQRRGKIEKTETETTKRKYSKEEE